MTGDLQRVIDRFSQILNAMRQRQQQLSLNPMHGQQPIMPHMNVPVPPNANNATTELFPQARPPNAGPSAQQHPPMVTSLRPPPVSLQPPIKRGTKAHQPSGSVGIVSTPSPVPTQSASTPAASAPTPTASSPPATKSPKARAPPKAKPARRTSKAVPVTTPATEPVASSSANAKRQREEEAAVNSLGTSSGDIANEPSPPKRAKTEWDSPPSEELQRKNEAAENIKTEEEASVFMEQITELIKSAGVEQSALTTDISETLDMILKGYGSVPDSSDNAGAMLLGESRNIRELTPPVSSNESFEEFIDFSFGALDEEENTSKAPTPDLVPSSSTGPSPESNTESEAPNHNFLSASSSIGEHKLEDMSDPLRLGLWKDIDGGEAGYYQSNDWKWDSPMNSLDQAWAIFN